MTAAAGGVGSLAIQIARLQGAARVIAVTSTKASAASRWSSARTLPSTASPRDSPIGCEKPTAAFPSTWCWSPSAAPSWMPR